MAALNRDRFQTKEKNRKLKLRLEKVRTEGVPRLQKTLKEIMTYPQLTEVAAKLQELNSTINTVIIPAADEH